MVLSVGSCGLSLTVKAWGGSGMAAQEWGQKRPDPCGRVSQKSGMGSGEPHCCSLVYLLLASLPSACQHPGPSVLPQPSPPAHPVGITAAWKEPGLEAVCWLCDLPEGINIMTLSLNVTAVMGI